VSAPEESSGGGPVPGLNLAPARAAQRPRRGAGRSCCHSSEAPQQACSSQGGIRGLLPLVAHGPAFLAGALRLSCH